MKIAGVNPVQFSGVKELQQYKENPITENFTNLSQDEKLNALHERLVRLNKQLANFETAVYKDNITLSKNQEKIQKFAKYAATCALYPPKNDDDANIQARNMDIATDKYFKVDVIA